MCNPYSLTRSQDALRQMFKVRRDLAGNLPLLPAIFGDTLLHRTPELTTLERSELVAEWIKLTDKLAQVGQVSKGGRGKEGADAHRLGRG
jgi:hypothetical protein